MNHKLLPNNANNLIIWEELFEYIQMYCDNHNLHKYSQIAGNGIDPIDFNNLTYRLRILGEHENIPFMQEKFNAFFSIFDLQNFVAEKEKQNLFPHFAIYFSFFPHAKSHGNHCDETDLFHWQQVGKTEWTITESGETYKYVLNPGDCIFLPEGTYHDVVPLTPRIGLSFGFWTK
jgi:hypothetical protein